jgi:hypothetical protein
MVEQFKVSRNARSYSKDITPNILHSGVYEIDLVDKNKNRTTQMNQVNYAVSNGHIVYFYITDSKNKIYRGEVMTIFERNYSNPFYLDIGVQEKSKFPIDISNHPFYTCKVIWNNVPLSVSECNATKQYYPKFLAKTIVKLNNKCKIK